MGTMPALSIRKFRCDDERWAAFSDRAISEGTTPSALIRQWIDDYVHAGVARANGRAHAPKVRLTAAERDAVRDALNSLGIATIVVDTINEERG